MGFHVPQDALRDAGDSQRSDPAGRRGSRRGGAGMSAEGAGFSIDPAAVRAWKRCPEYKDSGVEWQITEAPKQVREIAEKLKLDIFPDI